MIKVRISVEKKPDRGGRFTPYTTDAKTPAVNAYLVFEHPAADSNLTAPHQSELQNLCSYALTLGSGAGVCSCTQEDHDF